jgi:hypothetical protein
MHITPNPYNEYSDILSPEVAARPNTSPEEVVEELTVPPPPTLELLFCPLFEV